MAGIMQGVGPDGKPVSVLVTADGRLVGAEDAVDLSAEDRILLELRAIRIGMEMQLELDRGELLDLAGESNLEAGTEEN